MKMLLPNVNTSEGCFEIGVTISNPVFTEDAINEKTRTELLNKICIVSMLARFTSDAKRMCTMNSAFALVLTVFLVSGVPVDIAVSVHGQCRSV